MLSCAPKDKNEDLEYLEKTLSVSLSAIVDEYYQQYDFNINNTKITFNDKSIEFLPVIENIVNQNDRWLCAIRYEVLINNTKREEFTFGGVGVDDHSKIEAIKTGIIEWISFACLPILDYFFNNLIVDTYLELSNYKVFHGNTGIRGQVPEGWIDGSKDMHTKLLETILSSMNYSESETFCIYLEIYKEPKKTIDGICRINSRISEEVLNYLKSLNWSDDSRFMFKQFYIISAK